MAARLVVHDLFARFTTSGPEPLTARDVALFAQSPFSWWSQCHAPADARDPPSAFDEMIKEKGREHEARVLAERYPHARKVAFRTEPEGFQALLDAMASGAPSIAGLPILHGPRGIRGHVDVLERRDDAPSVFGPWHYVVKEIKLAKNLQDHHRLQAALYHWALGDVQGYLPPAFYLLNRDLEETAFTFSAPEMMATLAAMRAIRAGTFEPAPVLGGGAAPWIKHTDACAIARRDVSLVNGVSSATREKLAAAGYATVEALATANEDALQKIPGIGPKRAASMLLHANVLVEGRVRHLQAPILPSRGTEVYFDLEGTGENAEEDGLPTIDYLIGALVDGRYHSFVAATADDAGERQMFRDFLAWFDQLDDPVLYHWHHYERTHFTKLCERHGIDPALRTRLFASLRDLHKDATAGFCFPTYGTSIKVIAPFLGFTWRSASVNAMESIALYEDYATTGDRAKLQLVLDYNEDDCIATRVVKDWMVAPRPPTR